MALCASCRSPLPPGARFCPSCGHPVNEVAPEERRVVTVVFADLVGYTALTEHLDPERVKRLIDAAFERLIVDINNFGGRVDKVLGDGILALFGAPVAHEDDADRAIRAAIEMHSSLAKFVAEEADLDVPLRLRIGVNTGEVLVGAVSGTADYTAMGDVVNVASRLQALAAPGQIFVGDSTAELTSNEIMLELVDDLAVRGREQTERVWRVTGRRTRVSRLGTRNDFPFVGRAPQRELLSSVMSMVAGGRSAVVAVSGEAGSGKTRLVNEALDAFPSRSVTIFAGICAPYGETNAWSPIASALLRRLGPDADVPADQLRETVRDRGIDLYGFTPGDPLLSRFVEGILHLLEYPSELDQLTPAQRRETVFSLMVDAFRRRSAGGPIILWLDDLQWADALIIDLLHRFAHSLADRPMLIITAQRDGAEIDWPPTTDQPMTIRMPLEPLDRSEAAELIRAVLETGENPSLADELYERSGGNPLFLTELAELARDHPTSRELPGTLRALIAARLDELTPSQRAIVENAAVLGATGSIQSLERFAFGMGQAYDGDDLVALAEDGLIDADGTTWRFRSDVVREVAYQTLTKYVRAERHAAIAEIMAESPLMSRDQVAHHAASAAELDAEIGPVPGVRRDIGKFAFELLSDAAQRSLDSGAFNQARRFATRALDLGMADETPLRKLLLVRAQALIERRSADAGRADALEALDRALRAHDRHDEGIARRLLGILHQREGDLPAARRELGESVAIFRSLGDDIELASSLRERGFAEVFGGSLSDAEWLLSEAKALSERLDDRRGRAWVRQHQAWIAFLSGETDLAETRLTAAAEEFELLGDRAGRGWAFGLLAFVRFYQRRFEEAEKLAVEVSADARALGDRWELAMMDTLLASIRLWTQHFDEAEQLSRRAYNRFRDLGDKLGMIQATGPRLRALVALGRAQEAERGLEEALAISEGFGEMSFPAVSAAGAAVHMGMGARAMMLAESAVERSAGRGGSGEEARVTLALSLCQVGRPEDALVALEGIPNRAPYSVAVRALVMVLTGDVVNALELVDSIGAESGATYLDRTIASLAAVTAEIRLGHADAAASRLEAAVQLAAEAGDEVAKDLVAALGARIELPGSEPERHQLAPGWQIVIDGLAKIAREGSEVVAH